jgi:hypothetical protein
MEEFALTTVKIGKLSDGSYVVAMIRSTGSDSVSCPTTGKMLGIVLEYLLPYGRDDEWYAQASSIAAVVTNKADELIANAFGEDE